ncbi:polyphosphate polymerase domain-containing protein [Labilibaculum sp.]|uniref:polyphosphate polymerase domain-containing protein n=1 Tax=Labilibaculum sp. TaxID=2060723 RepID=UPI0035637B08
MDTTFFTPIQLKEMDKVKLMNRTDQKYWFHIDSLSELLQEIQQEYFLLHIKGNNQLPYTTSYFDTANNNMFAAHHNGKLNRYKIRRRTYVDSQISFMEIKFKSNKGRTIKKRIPTTFCNNGFTGTEEQFISNQSPFSTCELHKVLVNRFSRLTLVNKNFKERCTIDLDIEFEVNKQIIPLDRLVIVEIKSDGRSNVSPLAKALQNKRIKSSGFSKYCVGRSVTDPFLKRNAFKAKIRRIEKVTQTSIHLI